MVMQNIDAFGSLNTLGLSRTSRMNSQKISRYQHQTELIFSWDFTDLLIAQASPL